MSSPLTPSSSVIKDMKAKRLCLAYVFCGYALALCAQCAVTPWETRGFVSAALYLAAPMLTLFFGPYSLVPREAWIGSGTWWWIAQMLPLYVAHLAFVYGLLTQLSQGWRFFRRRWVRPVATGLVACWSALGIWFFIPVVERHVMDVGEKLPGDSVRLVLVTDLHSCRYGKEQRGLVEMVEAQAPDLILLGGDIFDDRLPDASTQSFVDNVAGHYPCVYVTGNHEYWSGRRDEMVQWLRENGVTVLEADCASFDLRGTPIDICGVDDPTYMDKSRWEGLLEAAWGKSDPSHFRILLTHRPECVGLYERFGYDLILAGHAHGGQWRLPFADVAAYAPNQFFFPRYSAGLYRLSGGSPMFISRGLARESTVAPRFFNHPEIVVFDLVKRN